MGTDCTSACLTTSVTIQSRDESIFKKFTYSVKIALSLAVYADDYPQFVLKINDYLMFLFVTFFCFFCSVVDLGCLSRIWFFSSRIWIFPSRIRVFPSRIWIFLSRIWDVYLGSGFFRPGSRIWIFLPGFRIWIFPSWIPDLEFSILFPEFVFLHPGSTSATLH